MAAWALLCAVGVLGGTSIVSMEGHSQFGVCIFAPETVTASAKIDISS